MWSENEQKGISAKILTAMCYAGILGGVYLIELHSYLLFHTIVELFSVCVACAIFMLVWNSRQFIQNNYMLFLGIAYLFVGGFDLLHALAYEGMGVFPGYDANLPTQLWIVTRYIESLSLLLAPLFLRRRLNSGIVIGIYSLVSALLLVSVFFWPIFPVCFRDSDGLTVFKETSEFIIIAILMVSLVAPLQKRSWFDAKVLRWLIGSIVLTMAAELTFTMYTTPSGHIIMIGHFLKLISFFMMYKALIETGMKQPHTLLYRRLKEHESALQEARDKLEIRVQQRTEELSHTVETLQEEIRERMRAEEAFRESESKYRTLVEQTPAVTYMAELNETRSTLYVSPQVESIMGFTVDDFQDDPDIWFKHLHLDDRQRVVTELAEMRHNNARFSCKYRFVKHNGKVVWLRDEARIVDDLEGYPRYIQGVVYDITLQKHMAQELAAQSRTLEAFFKHTITPLVILDRDFNFVRVNEAYARACQRQISDFTGLNYFELYPNDENRRIFERVVKTQVPYEAVARPFSFPDHREWGTTYWDWTLVPLLDEAGRVEFLVFSLRDVTRRHQAELAVVEKESHLRTVVGNAPVIFFAADVDGRITVSEGRGLAALGQSPGESVGSNVFDRFKDRPDILDNIRRALAGEEVAAEIEMLQGRIFDVRYAPLKDREGHASGIMGVAVDITETRHAQKQLRALASQLLSVEDQERRKIATALHDSIGQILAFLKIELGTLQRLELPGEAAHAIAHAREQIEEAVRQTRTLTFEISPPELYTLGLASALEELAQRFGQEKRIDCRVQSNGDPDPLSNQLKTLLYRSVRELLTNAAKHAQAHVIDIEIGTVDNCIQIAVVDDGVGFDMSHLTAHASRRGLGFGLLSIRERLVYLGGNLNIKSTPGQGTRVTLTVPLEHTRGSDGSMES